jgi:penicillin-binding protein 2
MKTKKRNHTGFEPWRMILFYGAIILLFVFYIYRLFGLQIVLGQEYVAKALANRTNTISLPAQRGTISDRNGVILARDVASYNLVITPANLPGDTSVYPVQEGAVQEIYRQLSVLVGMPINKGNGNTVDEAVVKSFTPCQTDLGIAQIVYIGATNWPFRPLDIKCNIDEKTAMTIREHASDWPGVGIEVQPIREYPTGSLTSDIIGFLGPVPESQATAQCYKTANLVNNRDKVGYAGIESQLQCDDNTNPLVPGNNGKPLLSGINGEQDVSIDVAGQQVSGANQLIPPKPGYSVNLTIDTRLQAIAQGAIKKWLDHFNSVSLAPHYNQAAVIAINPKTGEILSLVSYPSFENNRMARLIPADYYNQLVKDPLKPLFNQAISAQQPPGSTFKLAASLGILNEGVVTPDQKIEDPGQIFLTTTFSQHDTGFQVPYVCWIYKTTGGGHGMVDFLTGLAQSCDVYFYKVGGGYKDEVPNGGLGINRLGEYAKALGYGQASGIELPGEATGLIPTPKWKRLTQGENWSSGDTYIGTIGQGYVLSTPLQVLMSAAVIAADGKYVKPTLIEDIVDSEGKVVYKTSPQVMWDITKDPVITEFNANDDPINVLDANGNLIPDRDASGKQKTDPFGELQFVHQKKTVAPWVVKLVQEGMRKVVVDGTASAIFSDFDTDFPSAGKTGTAEYCDDVANKAGLCVSGRWPAHAWYIGYAPYDNPEIAVMAFVYHGDEGSTVAAPIVKDILRGYYCMKKVDQTGGQVCPAQ